MRNSLVKHVLGWLQFPHPWREQARLWYVQCVVGPEFTLWRTFRATLDGAVECHWLAPTGELWPLQLTVCSQAAIIYDGRGLLGCLDISPLQWWSSGKLKGHSTTAGSGNPRMGGEGWHGASEDMWMMIIPGASPCVHILLDVISDPHLKISILGSQRKYAMKEYWELGLIQLCLFGGGVGGEASV